VGETDEPPLTGGQQEPQPVYKQNPPSESRRQDLLRSEGNNQVTLPRPKVGQPGPCPGLS
jgi:hypothetical protein